MNIEAQIRKARAFRQMHDRRNILVLANAWDAVTARLFARLGFPAVATTSGGVAWSLGYPDGEHAPLAEVVAATGRIAHAVDVMVSTDSGPHHIGAALGKPVVTVMGPTLPAWIENPTVKNSIVRSEVGLHRVRPPGMPAAAPPLHEGLDARSRLARSGRDAGTEAGAGGVGGFQI